MNKNSRILTRSIAAALASLVLPQAAQAANGTWNVDANGDWGVTTNWTGGTVADGATFTANFTFNITADRTINLEAPRTIGNLVFTDLTTVSNNFIVSSAAGAALTLDVTSGNSSISTTNAGRTASINVQLSGADGIVIPTTSLGIVSFGSNLSDYTGQTIIANGATLQLGAGAATAGAGGGTTGTTSSLGAGGLGNETVIQGGGALNINGQNLGNIEIIRVQGFGNATIAGAALVNNGGGNNNALATVILTGDAAFGGSGRFDIRNNTPLLDLAGFRLTKIGANQFSVVGGSITSGNIDVNAGTFSIESNTLVQGAGNISLNPGGTLGLWNNVAGRQTRTIVLNGGTINELGSGVATSTVSSPILLSANSTISVSGTSTTTLTLPGNITQSGGNFGITKTNGGTLALNGAQSWTGPLTINDGAGRVNLGAGVTLLSRNISVGDGAILDASLAGDFSIPSGGTVTIGRTSAATDFFGNFTAGPGTTLNIGPLYGGANAANRIATFSNDVTLNGATVNLQAGVTGTSDRLAATNLTLSGTNTINIQPHFGQDFGVGILNASYVIATYTGTLTGGAANLVVGNASEYRQTFSFDTATLPGAVFLNVTGAPSLDLVWNNGAGNRRWDVNASANWTGEKFYTIDRVKFTTLAAGDVEVVGAVKPASVEFASGNYNIGGKGTISGPAIVTKTGADRVAILNEFNDYSGGTTIVGGTLAPLVYSNNGVVGSLGVGNVVLDGVGAILEYVGGTATSNRTTQLGDAGGTIKITNPLATLTLSTAMANSATSSGVERTLIKTGPGALTLSAAPTFGISPALSGISVTEGVLRAGIANLSAKHIDVASGATFDPNGFNGNTAGLTRPTLNITGTGVKGQAAIWNGGGAQTNTSLFGRINLLGDASIGTPVRYDFTGGTGTDSQGVAGITFNANTFAVQLVGSGEKWWSANVGAVVNDVFVMQGRLGVQQANNLNSHPSITNSAIYVLPAGELATFGENTTNKKSVVLAGGLLASTGGGTSVSGVWRGGVSLGLDSFVDNRGTAVANNITIDSDATSPTVAPLTLGNLTLEKLGSSGNLILQDTGFTGLGSGDGNVRIYNGAVIMRGGFKMDGAGEVQLKNFGQLQLDDTNGPVVLTKSVRLDGGTLNNVSGSHTTGSITVGAHGRIANNAAGTTLTLGNITSAANNGLQFFTAGSIILGQINGAAPVVGANNRLGVNWVAGPNTAGMGFATWDGVSVGTLAPTVTNSTTPTAADDALYTAATTLAGTTTVNTLTASADVIIPAGATLTVQSGGIIQRGAGADYTIGTASNSGGKLTSGSADGRLVFNATEVIDSRNTLVRAQIIDAPLAGGAFRPVIYQKNGPGQNSQQGIDNGNNMVNNLYSGGTIINGGRMVPNGTNALGTGPVTINDGGQLAMFNLTGGTGQATYLQNNVVATGRGAGENGGYFGAIRVGSNAALTGNVSVSGVTRIHNQNGQGNLSGVFTGTGTIQHTGNNITWITNPASTYTAATQLGYRDQTGAISILVSKLANGGQPSSIGASSNAASNLVFEVSPSLRYVGIGDSTDRLFTLGGGFNLNGAASAIIDGSGYGALNFTNAGSLAFASGSYRTLILRASSLFTGATVAGEQMPLNVFAPNLGDPADHGFGQLTKDGIGRWAITANHTYSGVTTVNDGILVLGNGGTTGMFGNGAGGLGPNQVTINNNASVQLNRTDNYTIPNNLVSGNANGNTEVVQIGSGVVSIAGYNDNSSTRVRVESGVMELAKPSNVGIHAAALLATIGANGTLRLAGTGNDQIFDGATSGVWTTVQMNGGTFDMNGRDEAVYRVEGTGTITNTAASTTSTLTLGGSLLNVGNGSSVIGGGVGATLSNGAGVLALTKNGTGTIALTAANTNTGITTVNNGILSIGNGGTTGQLGTGAVTVATNGTLAFNRSNALAFTNAISGNGGITQQGTGTTTVSAPLGYTGTTTVNRGTLEVNLATNNNVLPSAGRLLLNGGTVSFVGGAGGSSAQTIGELRVAGGDINVNGSAGLTTLNLPASFLRSPGGTVNFTTTGTTAINSTVSNANGVIGTATAAYATFNGKDWATGTGTTIGALPAASYAVDIVAPGSHTDVSAVTTIPGGTTATLRLNTPAANVLTNTGALVLEQGGILITPVMTAGSGIVGGTITGNAGLGSEVIVHQNTTGGVPSATQIASTIIDNGANATGLTKAGPGILALVGANTYTGETHVNQGTLAVGAFGTAGTLGIGPVVNDAVLAFARTDSITVNNSIAGNGQVVQAGGTNSVVRLLGANSFTGGLLISAGTVSGDRGFGGGQNLTNNVFSLGGTTTLATANLDPVSSAGVGPITLGDANTGTANVAFLSEAGADFANPITVTSNGTGTATIGSTSGPSGGINPAMFTGAIQLDRATTFLGNNNDRTTYVGVITGNPGTITISGSQGGTNTGGLNRTTWENTNTFTGNVVIAANATLQVGTGAFAASRDQIPDTADVTLNATSFLTLNGDSETIGTLNSTANNAQIQSAAGGSQSLRILNGGTYNGIFNGGNNTGMTIEVAGGTMTFGGTSDNPTGRLRASAGTTVLAKASTTGVHAAAVDLTIAGGTVQIAGTFGGTAPNYGAGVTIPANFRDQIYDGSAGASSAVVLNSGTLDLNGNSEGFGRLDGYGGTVTNGIAATTSTLFLGTANISNLATAGFFGNIQDGAGTIALGKVGTGISIFAGNLTHTGGTSIYSGALQIGNGGNTGTISGNVNLVNANASSFIVNRSGSVTLPGAISGGGPVILNGTGDVFFTGANSYTGSTTINAGALHVGDGGTTGELGSGNVTVRGNLIFQRSNALTISSAIAGDGKVLQDGTGTVTYTGIASHLGGTFVDSGTLLVNGSVSGTTTVNGGTLGGIGNLGIVNVTSGTLAPGGSVGLLNTGNLAFSAGSTFAVEIDALASYDAVNVTGTAALGNATLSLSGSYAALGFGDLFFIVRNDGNDALSGTFQGLPEGGTVFATGGQRYLISYTGNFDTLSATGGNDVVLTAVPEPGSIAMLLGGLGLLCARRRRES